jgi:AI-2 transport protein TqsA
VAEDEQNAPGAAGEAIGSTGREDTGSTGAAAPGSGVGDLAPLLTGNDDEVGTPDFGTIATGAFNSPSTRLVLVAASVIVIILGMKYAADVVTPVIMSLVITIGISPLLSWQVRKGVPGSVAFITTLVVTAVVGLGVMFLLMGGMAHFINDLPNYKDELQPYWDALMSGLEKIGIDTSELANVENVDPEKIISVATSLASGVIGTIQTLSVMALTVLFMLMEATTFSKKLTKGMASGALKRIDEMTADMRSFIKVTAVMGAIVALLETIMLVILGVPSALLWGLLSFFFSFIPFIGFIAAMIPPIFMGLVSGGWPVALAVLIGYLVINTISDNLIKPKVMGSQTNLSPLTVFLSVMLWGWVFGPVGGLLAVPVTLLAKRLILEAYDEWKWVSVAIGELPKEPGAQKKRRRPRLVRRFRSRGEPKEGGQAS